MDAGLRCLVHTHPKFRERAQQGFNIVVGGKGSSNGFFKERKKKALVGLDLPSNAITACSREDPQPNPQTF
jgi:hypothetical protein